MMFNNEYGIIRNMDGTQIRITRINKHEETFKYKKMRFYVDRGIKPIVIKFSFGKRKYWVYNSSNPNPYNFTSDNKGIDSTQLNTLLESKILYDLNRLKNGLNLNWKVLAIGGLVLIAIYLVATGKFP